MKLRLILLVMLALIFMVFAAGYAVIFTQPGTRWLVERVAGYPSLGLSFVGVKGTLWEGLRVEEFRYRSEAVSVQADRAALRIELRDLLRSRLNIIELTASRILLTGDAAADAEKPATFVAPDIPIDVRLQSARVGELRIDGFGLDENVRDIVIEGDVTGQRVDIRQLSLSTRDISINAGAQLQITDDLPLRAEVQWDAPTLRLSGQGAVTGNINELTIEHRVFTPDVVRVNAVISSPLESLRYSATATAERLQLPAGDAPIVLNDASVRLDGDLTELRLDDFSVRAYGGLLAGTGKLGLAAPMPLEFRFSAAEVDLSQLTEVPEGSISFDARLSGSVAGALVFESESLDGRIGEYRIAGATVVTRDAGKITTDKTRLSIGDNSIDFSGQLVPRVQGRFDLVARDLAQLLPRLAGRLEARGTFGGTMANPVLDVTGKGSALSVGDQALADAAFNARIRQDGSVVADADVRGIQSGNRTLGNAALKIDGVLTDHRLAIDLTEGPIAASLSSAGSYADNLLAHTVSAALIDLGELGMWRLDGPAAVHFRLDNQNLRISPHCWTQRPAAACVEQTIWTGAGFTTAATLARFPVDQFNVMLPPYLRVSGFVDANMRLSQTSAGFRGSASFRQENLLVTYTTEQNEVLETTIESTVINAEATDATAVLSLDTSADYSSNLSARMVIDKPFDSIKPISGQFSGKFPDVSQVAPLIELATGLKDATGELNADGRIFGTLAEPRFSGGVFLVGGSAFVPATGISLSDVRLAVEGTDDGRATVEGVARSGDGEVRLAGSLSLMDRSARVRITGDRFETLRMPDQQAIASPDLTVGYADDRIDIDGTLKIPSANFVIQELPETAVTPSVDAIDHDAQQSVADRRAPAVKGTITVVLGDAVKFSGFGLKTGITGELRLRQDAKRQLRANGILRLEDGRFTAYGQKLSIERGTLIFSGPIDDPKVDVKASRTVKYEGTTVKAGVLLTGTASNITTRVFSEPVMSEANALSYLVIGRPIEKAGSGDSAALTNAAITMGLRQALPVVKQIGESVGLDEVGIGGDSTDETSFLAGKQINDDLSIRYTYGLFSRIGTFIARYSLGGGFNIEASSGEDQSLELIYTLDR